MGSTNLLAYNYTCSDMSYAGRVLWRALGGEEGVKTVQFILGRWVEAVGMCLMEGDNVATRKLRSSAETLRASISAEQLEHFQTENCPFFFFMFVQHK